MNTKQRAMQSMIVNVLGLVTFLLVIWDEPSWKWVNLAVIGALILGFVISLYLYKTSNKQVR